MFDGKRYLKKEFMLNRQTRQVSRQVEIERRKQMKKRSILAHPNVKRQFTGTQTCKNNIGTQIVSAEKRQNKCLPTDIKGHKNEQLADKQKLKKRYTVKLLKKTKKRGRQRDKE